MKFNLFQHFFLPLYCATLFAVHQHQALDIATIPVNKIKDVTTINKSDPVDLDNTVPRFTYRVVVNDHFHLQCTPLSDPLKYDVHEEVWTAKKKKTKGKLNTTAPLDEIETADGYFRLHNFDVAFFGNQLALLQARSTWWVEAGENLTSLVAAFREKKLKEAGVLMAGLFEADNVTPQYLCRSLKNPTELGLQSLSDGLCRTVEPLPEGGVKNPKDWSIRGSTLTNYQLLTSLQKDDIFNWTELNAVEVLHGGWTPPPNAVEVDIGKTDVSSSYHSPLYIARYKVNSSLTVVMALPRGAQLVLDNAAAGVELLVVSEVSYQVKVRFSGLGVHLLNSLAEKWDEKLNCKLDAKTDGSAGDSSSCSCGPEVEKKTNEIQLVDLKMENLKRNAVLGKSKLNSKSRIKILF